jgi:hypothetical protein
VPQKPLTSIALKKLRDLDLDTPASMGRPLYLSAASGLVIVKSTAYVVADDEHHLGVFSLTKRRPGKLLRILPGDLPTKKKARKKHKADLEALLVLPSFRGCRHGALFALGSGSTKKRKRGVLLPLNARGQVGTPRLIDVAPWFKPIEDAVGELNIEGAFIANGRLHLLQRGNKGAGVNAIVKLPLDRVLDALASDALDALPFTVRRYALGAIEDIPLGFTDACALADGRIVFTAVAEDSDNAYDDGACAGAVIGILAANGKLQSMRRLIPAAKVEGIDARIVNHKVRMHLVSDADDINVPAALYVAEVRRA